MLPLGIGLAISTASLWEELHPELAALPVRIVFEGVGMGDAGAFLEKIERTRPDAVFLDPFDLSVPLPELIRAIQATSASPKVVVVSDSSAPGDILYAIRAGASEYLYPPLKDQIKAALERLSAEPKLSSTATRPEQGKVFGFLSAKGGCGATTIVTHAAVECGRRTGDKTTLLADFDLISGIIRSLVQSKVKYSTLDALTNFRRLDTNFWKGIVSNGLPGLEVLSGPSIEPLAAWPSHLEMRGVLRFARTQYAHTFVDLGRGLLPGLTELWEEFDGLAIVTTLDMPALQQCKLLLRQIQDHRLDTAKRFLILNRLSRRSEIRSEDVENVLGVPVYASIPNDYPALEKAYSSGKLLEPEQAVRQAIARLVVRMAGLPDESRKKKFSLFGD